MGSQNVKNIWLHCNVAFAKTPCSQLYINSAQGGILGLLKLFYYFFLVSVLKQALKLLTSVYLHLPLCVTCGCLNPEDQ